MGPVFISLVGEPQNTSALYVRLQQHLSAEFAKDKPTFLGDPFGDYDTIKIGGKRKSEYSPEARVHFRWGLFFEFNKGIVRPAIDDGSNLILVPRYGFDLYAGATVFQDSPTALAIHLDNVKHGVKGLGINPPIYVFTNNPSSELQIKIRQYFDREHGQNEPTYAPPNDTGAQAAFITNLIYEELAKRNTKANVA